MSMSEEFPNPNLRRKHAKQLVKTEMCRFFLVNKCGKGSRCPFAHSPSEIREKPDLGKTTMCPYLLTAGACTNPVCAFAHDERDLRTAACLFRTKMCSFAASGRCKHGAACRFAHDRGEVLAASEQPAPGADAGAPDARARGAAGQPGPGSDAGAQDLKARARAPTGRGAQPGGGRSSSAERSEQAAGGGREASSDQSTRGATSAHLSTPEGSGASVRDESPEPTERRRRKGTQPRPCTTIMLSNVPDFLTQGAVVSLLEDLTECMRGAFDFFYCPWNPGQDRNLGYAIINFFLRSTSAEFERRWANQPLLPESLGVKKMKIVPGALQGRSANIRHFSGFSLAHHEDPRFRPLVRVAASEALRPMALPHEITQGLAARGPGSVAPTSHSGNPEQDDFQGPYHDLHQSQALRQQGQRDNGMRGGPHPMEMHTMPPQERWEHFSGFGFGQQQHPRFQPPGRRSTNEGSAKVNPGFASSLSVNPTDYLEHNAYQDPYEDPYHGRRPRPLGHREGAMRGGPSPVVMEAMPSRERVKHPALAYRPE